MRKSKPSMAEQIEDLKAENAALIKKVQLLEETLWMERLEQQRAAQRRACANGNGLHR